MAIGTVLAVGSLLAQLGSLAYKTAADKRRNEELEKMQAREKAGDLGLTDEERAVLDETYMGPVRAQAKEAQVRQMALAGESGNRYGGQLMAERQKQQESMARLGQEAGTRIATADIEEKRREKEYIDQLVADKAQRQVGTVAGVGQALGSMAKFYGAKEGSLAGYLNDKPAPFDADVLRQAGYGESQIEELMALLNTPEGQQAFEALQSQPVSESEMYAEYMR